MAAVSSHSSIIIIRHYLEGRNWRKLLFIDMD